MSIKLRLQAFDDKAPAIITKMGTFSYRNLLDAMDMFDRRRYKPGQLVSITAELDPVMAIGKMLSAIEQEAIVVPMIERRAPDLWNIKHEHYDTLRKRRTPGLVLFTSGSSGQPKVAVHDLRPLLDKWGIYTPKPGQILDARRTMCFLGFDHIGGLNTIFHVLFNGGCVVFPSSRDAAVVAEEIDKHQVEILPASPTFLKMLLLKSQSDHPSLGLITYGTEPMHQSTLNSIQERWPRVKFKQTYGLTELGIFSTKSKGRDSLWMQVKGDYRIVDNMLEIKTKSTMIGYLNAPSPITADGYYQTGDQVEVDGDWLRIIGRKSEFINVGGEKVHPTEIESEIMKLDEILDCLVEPVSNPIMGQIIKAKVLTQVNAATIKFVIKSYLKTIGFPAWKIPQIIEVTTDPLHNSRHKKARVSCSVSEDCNVGT